MRARVQRKRHEFRHQDLCQLCLDAGELLCCDRCPASYHLKCLGLKTLPKGLWYCPHHVGCMSCGRSGAAASLLFRCEVCPNAFCEDCLPPSDEVDVIGDCQRFLDLGYSTPQSVCFIRCSVSCATYLSEGVPEAEILVDIPERTSRRKPGEQDRVKIKRENKRKSKAFRDVKGEKS